MTSSLSSIVSSSTWMLAMIAPIPTSSSGSESSLAGPKSSSPSYLSPSKLSSEGSVVSAEVCPSTSASVPIACRRADSGVLGHSFDPLWCPFCPHAKHARQSGCFVFQGLVVLLEYHGHWCAARLLFWAWCPKLPAVCLL